MTKVNKLSIGILAIAIVLLTTYRSVAQSASSLASSPATFKEAAPQSDDVSKVETVQTTSSLNGANDELSRSLNETKAVLEKGIADKSLSQKQIAELNSKISSLQQDVDKNSNAVQPMKMTAASELANFKADPAYPELSNLRLSLLKAKAALEAGQINNKLNAQEETALTNRIAFIESKIAVEVSHMKPNTINK